MKRLMNKLKIDAEKRNPKVTGKKLAPILSVSPGMISNYYNNTSEISAYKFIQMSQEIYKDNPAAQMERMGEFVEKTTKEESLLELLEWVSNSSLGLTIEQVERRARSLDLLHDDIQIYKLLFLRKQRKVGNSEFFFKIEELKRLSSLRKESEILLQIATLYSLVSIRPCKDVADLAANILERVNLMEDGYIKSSFRVRIKEVIAVISFYNDDLAKVYSICRQLTEEDSIRNFPFPAISAFNIMAQANLETEDISLENILNAIELYNRVKLLSTHQLKEESLYSTHDFIKIFHGQFEGLYLMDLSEQVHLYAKTNKAEEALSLLEQIKLDKSTYSGHQYYYRWLVTGDAQDKEGAIMAFADSGNKFYTRVLFKS